MVSRVLRLEQGIYNFTIVLNRVYFQTGSDEQGVNVGSARSTTVVPTIFLKSYSVMSFT